ncbi:MAG: helix-turn-helix domain-containing protein, partial [Chloroflexota bacterium]
METNGGEHAAISGEQLGDLLTERRREAGMTQEALASASGVSLRTIQGMESSRGRVPHPFTLDLIAESLGLSEADRERLQAAAQGARVRERGRSRAARRLADSQAAELPDLAPILGREPDLAAIEELLAADAPFLTLIGPGGVGKTRLARGIADRRRLAALPFLWIPLDAISSPDLVLPAIARAASLPDLG